MLDLENILNKQVMNREGSIGTIVSENGVYLEVQYANRVAKYNKDAFVNKYLSFVDVTLQEQVEVEIENIRDMQEKIENEKKIKAAEDAQKRKEELEKKKSETAKKKAAADERAKKRNENKKSAKIHPYIDYRRKEGKPAIFMVCQNNTYDVESNHGYIWAPEHRSKGETDIASHAELDLVKAGDIVIHHFANRIWAVSVAKKDCELKAALPGHPSVGEIGRYVDLSYHFLESPADTTGLKEEKTKYGSQKYGPFEVTGKNKEGFYLSELADEIAKAFINEAIKDNPNDSELLEFKNKI